MLLLPDLYMLLVVSSIVSKLLDWSLFCTILLWLLLSANYSSTDLFVFGISLPLDLCKFVEQISPLLKPELLSSFKDPFIVLLSCFSSCFSTPFFPSEALIVLVAMLDVKSA